MLTALIFFATLGCCFAQNETIGLGQGIFVPQTDLLGSIPNGIHVFESLQSSCIEKVPLNQSVRYENYVRDTSSLYTSISTSTGMKASYQADFTMGFTLDVTTKSISSTKRTASGDSLRLAAKSFQQYVSSNCLLQGTLLKEFVEDFQALNSTINKPWMPESWRMFKIFLQKYGSHVITAVTYGSSINQYSFAKTSSGYSERDFTVKSCVSLAGPTGVDNINVSVCANITKEEISKVSHMEMTDTLTVTGGTPETRNKIIHSRSAELIEKFMEEGNTNPAPIQYILKPVWELLQERFGSTIHLPKAVNLEYYYNGYLNFGCPYIEQHGQELQKFELAHDTTPQTPEYQCTLAPQSCHSYDDCHYHVGVWCNCKGDSCIRYDTVTLDTGVTRTTAAPYYGGGWGGNGCDWKVWGSVCDCKHELKQRTIIWSGDSKRALYLVSDKSRKPQAEKKEKEEKKKEEL